MNRLWSTYTPKSEHTARSPKRVGLPKRPRYNPDEKARTLLLEFPAWAVAPEKLDRLTEAAQSSVVSSEP